MLAAHSERSHQDADHSIDQAIRQALKGIRFGSVEIIIHDSKVVQIERREKLRLDTSLERPVRRGV
jgi:hypothetical protein